MTRLTWDNYGSRLYEAGVSRGVLYLNGQAGIPWNGITSLTEKANGGTEVPYYIDGQKFLSMSKLEEFQATLTAFTYPDEFAVCDGTAAIRPGLLLTAQKRQPFSLSYRTMIGNDSVGTSYGYKIHLIYNALAAPSDHKHSSLTDSYSPDDFSWSLTALPSAIAGYRNTAHVILDSTQMDPTILTEIENLLYGSDDQQSQLPTISELVDIVDNGGTLILTDNGDGTFSMTAPITDLEMLDNDIWQLTNTGVTDNGDGTFTITTS